MSNASALLAYLIAATALLGSPGPGIAALIAVGRQRGLRGGLGFFLALQFGLALAAGLSAFGLYSLLSALPSGRLALKVAAVAYLLWLAASLWRAPVGGEVARTITLGRRQGFVLGAANPKAYAAFASLMGSFTLVNGASGQDLALKWTLCVAVMWTVDFAWLAGGAVLRRADLTSAGERMLNRGLAACVAAAAAATVFG